MSFHPLSAVRTGDALRTASLSQKDQMRYWLTSSLIGLVYNYQSSMVGLQLDWFFFYEVIVAIAITIIGVREAYKANGSEAGPDFLMRAAALSVPLGILILALHFLLYMVMWYGFPHVFDYQTFRNPAMAWHIVVFVLWNGLAIWFWWRLCHHLKRVSRNHHE